MESVPNFSVHVCNRGALAAATPRPVLYLAGAASDVCLVTTDDDGWLIVLDVIEIKPCGDLLCQVAGCPMRLEAL